MVVRRWGFYHYSGLHQEDAEDLGPRQHRGVPYFTCQNNMCLATCSGLLIHSQNLVGDGVYLDQAMVELDGFFNMCLGDVGVWVASGFRKCRKP
jgi:hypothetical protein